MFETIRNNSKIFMGILVLLIVPSFVLFGVDGYSNMADRGTVVATVGNQNITQQEWDANHQQEVDRIRASMPNLDAKLLGSEESRYATLERMLNDRLIALAADKQLLVTSDQRLANYLQQDPSIARLRGPDGKLDMDRYRQLAASQGMTPDMLESRVRRDLSNQQVLAAVQGSALASQRQADGALQVFLQQREIQIQRFEPATFAPQVKVTDAELEKFYQAHTDSFRSAESADVEYLVLDAAVLAKTIQLPEQDLKTYYEQNVQRLASKEQRRASHILINASKDVPPADRAKARAKADGLLASLRQDPKAFANLARQNSDDPGSASRGGDLDFFAKGAMVKAFEEAAFAMKKGDISEVVESEFGFHIIQLTDIKAPVTPSLEVLRPQMETELRQQLAKRRFAEYAETFSNSVYEEADSFKAVAEKLKLTVVQAQGLSRTPAPGAAGVLSNPKILEALFAEDSVTKRRNTPAIEVGSNTLVSARIVNYRPAAVLALADVKPAVTAQYVQEQALALAKAQGVAQMVKWKAQPDQAQLGAALVVSRDSAQGQAPALLDAVLRADPAAMPTWLGVELGQQGYAVVRVNKLVPRDAPNAQLQTQSREQFARLLGNAEAAAYLAYLKAQFKAEIKVAKPKPVIAS